jgi:hypothetical protein
VFGRAFSGAFYHGSVFGQAFLLQQVFRLARGAHCYGMLLFNETYSTVFKVNYNIIKEQLCKLA